MYLLDVMRIKDKNIALLQDCIAWKFQKKS